MKGQAPTKNFFHDGTEYIVTGNEGLAAFHFHEVRSFLHATKRSNVNKLPIIRASKEFDDGTVANLSLINGIEIVNIFAPSHVFDGEVRKKIKTVEIEQIVPVMRSIDNKYWLACMSGTFEPPYYTFKNIYDLPAEAFDDNIEIDIDKQLISMGHDEYDGSIDDPELYFIAQTGIRPDVSDMGRTEDSGYDSGKESDAFIAYVGGLGGTRTYCDITGQFHDVSSMSYAYDRTFYRLHTVWGDHLPIEGRTFHYVRSLSGPCTIESDTVALESFGGEETRHYDYTVTTTIETRAEVEDVSKFACCYVKFIVDDLGSLSTPYSSCFDWSRAFSGLGQYTALTKKYFFQVGDKSFQFFEDISVNDPFLWGYSHPWIDVYQPVCRTEENMVKYYGEDSGAGESGIMCGMVWSFEFDGEGEFINEDVKGFYYNFIRDDEQDMTTTLFIPDTNDQTHIMANVSGIDDTVKFSGEIFLGLVKYEIEYK